jgi:hypothetical protein
MNKQDAPTSTGGDYVNRKGNTYFLQAGKTKTGKPKYYLARKITGTPLQHLPDGYEIYENPASAIAVVRKVTPTQILPEEHRLVEERSRALSGVKRIIVDVEPSALVVYVPGMSDADADDLFSFVGPMMGRREEAKDAIVARSVYTPMLRFELDDLERRLFAAQRWCFLGRIDGWMMLSPPRPLEEQVKRFARHLGKESFYELI